MSATGAGQALSPEVVREILDRLIDLGVQQEAVVDRLDKLNGKVATQEGKLTDMALREAERLGREQGARSVVGELRPAIWAIVGLVGMLILLNAPRLIPAIQK
jgi:hypothetical protein